MFYIGPISSIFDYATFAVMWFVLGANAPEHQKLFQTGWFVESLLSQTLIVHIIRTGRIPFVQSCASLPLTITGVVICVIGVALPFLPIGALVRLRAAAGHVLAVPGRDPRRVHGADADR